ncbi:translation initiation factor IF-2-like [Panicum virgatum]|uniref:translation initiation factor IF-2-like n=1 Tax=Panicum virgatum TaxID=38727 RepID=UPI0019D4F80A|nr:translation initiation factor IF-2-like [Panicum virgatum]
MPVLEESRAGAEGGGVDDSDRRRCSCLPFCFWGGAKSAGAPARKRRRRRRLRLSWLAWPWFFRKGGGKRKGAGGDGSGKSKRRGTRLLLLLTASLQPKKALASVVSGGGGALLPAKRLKGLEIIICSGERTQISLSFHLAYKLCSSTLLYDLFLATLAVNPSLRATVVADLLAAHSHDPACVGFSQWLLNHAIDPDQELAAAEGEVAAEQEARGSGGPRGRRGQGGGDEEGGGQGAGADWEPASLNGASRPAPSSSGHSLPARWPEWLPAAVAGEPSSSSSSLEAPAEWAGRHRPRSRGGRRRRHGPAAVPCALELHGAAPASSRGRGRQAPRAGARRNRCGDGGLAHAASVSAAGGGAEEGGIGSRGGGGGPRMALSATPRSKASASHGQRRTTGQAAAGSRKPRRQLRPRAPGARARRPLVPGRRRRASRARDHPTGQPPSPPAAPGEREPRRGGTRSVIGSTAPGGGAGGLWTAATTLGVIVLFGRVTAVVFLCSCLYGARFVRARAAGAGAKAQSSGVAGGSRRFGDPAVGVAAEKAVAVGPRAAEECKKKVVVAGLLDRAGKTPSSRFGR